VRQLPLAKQIEAVREYLRTRAWWRGAQGTADQYGVSRSTLWRFLWAEHVSPNLFVVSRPRSAVRHRSWANRSAGRALGASQLEQVPLDSFRQRTRRPWRHSATRRWLPEVSSDSGWLRFRGAECAPMSV